MEAEGGGGDNRVKVLMLPWLAHGHISPFLELAKRLSERNCVVYMCSTAATLASIRGKLTHPHHLSSVHLLELFLPATPDLPPHLHTTNALPTSLISSLMHLFDMAAPSFSEILHSIHPHLLIYDIFQHWAPAAASAAAIPSCLFLTCSAAAAGFFIHARQALPSPFPFPSISLRHHELGRMNSFLHVSGSPRVPASIDGSNDLVLIRTSEDIEKDMVQYLGTLIKKRMVSLGSLFQKNVPAHTQVEDGKMKEWLAGKREATVLFVSFGTEYFPSEEEMEELAWGLEMSGVNFIWVARFPAGEEVALPEGFLEMVEGRGKVVEWASQREILQHSSVGGMVSHCGWGSLMEAMESGVPVVGLPMKGDQPLNCRLVTEIGVGVEVERGEDGKLLRGRLAEVVREVVVGEKGEKMRKKTREMQRLLRGDKELEHGLDCVSGIIGRKI